MWKTSDSPGVTGRSGTLPSISSRPKEFRTWTSEESAFDPAGRSSEPDQARRNRVEKGGQDAANSHMEHGGIRVIYTVRLKRGAVVLLTIYSKSAKENIPSHVLRQIAEELDHD